MKRKNGQHGRTNCNARYEKALAIAPLSNRAERAAEGLRVPGPHTSGAEHPESIRGFVTFVELGAATGIGGRPAPAWP